MKLKKNKIIIFYAFNIILLLVLLVLAVPASKFLSRVSIEDNKSAINQTIINSKAKSPKIINRSMNVQLFAKVDDLLEWEFKSLKDRINIKLGENIVVRFEGKNLSERVITSTANFFASPDSAHPYIIKTECFCFKEQTLKPGESQIFTMVFFIDPSLDSVKKLKDLKELVFTYEFSEYKS